MPSDPRVSMKINATTSMHYHGTPGEVNPCWCSTPNVVKGEPYGRVKEKARYMASQLYGEQIYAYDKENALDPYERIIRKLIETCPEQTLDALCEVMDPDATT